MFYEFLAINNKINFLMPLIKINPIHYARIFFYGNFFSQRLINVLKGLPST